YTLLLFYSLLAHPQLHSFPTRRSSDLTAPNRVFNIEWHAVRHNATANTADVEIRFYENTPSFFDVFYNFVGDNGGNEGSGVQARDRKSTRLNSSHVAISYAVFCLKKKK